MVIANATITSVFPAPVGICTTPRPDGAFYCLLHVHSALDPLVLVERLVREHRVAAVLEKHGGQVVPFQFERRGLVTWASGAR